MKKKAYKISVQNPCHEAWDGMTPNEKGRFCSSCQKTVIDFSCKEDREIYETLKTGNVCGRFTNRQIIEPIVISELTHVLPWWKAAALAAFSLFTYKTAEGKELVKATATIIRPLFAPKPNPSPGPDLSPPKKKQVRITVVDSVTHVPLKYAYITDYKDNNGIKDTLVNSFSIDSNGTCIIDLPIIDGLIIHCNPYMVFYKPQEIKLDSIEDKIIYMPCYKGEIKEILSAEPDTGLHTNDTSYTSTIILETMIVGDISLAPLKMKPGAILVDTLSGWFGKKKKDSNPIDGILGNVNNGAPNLPYLHKPNSNKSEDNKLPNKNPVPIFDKIAQGIKRIRAPKPK